MRNLRIDPRRYRERAINVPAAVEREVPNNSHFMLSRFRYVAVSFPPRHSVYVIPVATIASLSLLRVSWLQSGLPFALIVTYPAVRQLLQASSSPPPPPPLFFLPTRKLLWMSSFLLIIPSKLVFHQVFYTCYYEDNIKISRFYSDVVWIIKKKLLLDMLSKERNNFNVNLIIRFSENIGWLSTKRDTIRNAVVWMRSELINDPVWKTF